MIEEVLRVKCQVSSRAGRPGSLPRLLASNLTLQTPAPPPTGLLVQTNPFRPRRTGIIPVGEVGFAWGSESWARRPCHYMPIRRSAFPGEPIVPNKPNFAGRASPGRWKYAKRTQFRPARPSTAPPYTWLNCAKQSQFRPRRQGRQRLGRQGVMVNRTFDRPRQNKANSGEPGGDPGVDYAKQSQFRRGGQSCQTNPIGRRKWCETKPISRDRAEAMDIKSATPGRPGGRSGAAVFFV
jgi:hypothetical protein